MGDSRSNPHHDVGDAGRHGGGWRLAPWAGHPEHGLDYGSKPCDRQANGEQRSSHNRPANDALKLRDSGSDIALVGDAHYHPGGSPRPSTNDFKGWERGFTTINKGDYQPTYVGLIATGRPASPTFHAWAVRRVDGQLVTKPALVRGL